MTAPTEGPDAIQCPECGWHTLTWVQAAPGPSDWVCVVCDLRAENTLLRESRDRIAATGATEIELVRQVIQEAFIDGPDDQGNAKAIPYPSLSPEAADAVRRALATTEGGTP